MGTAIPIAVAQALSGAAAAAGASAATIVGATYAGLAIGYAATAYLINAAATALMGGQPQQKGAGIDMNYAGTFEPRRIVYGEARVGGMQTIPPIATGSDGKFLHFVLAIAGHECESMTDVWFDDEKIVSADIGAISSTLDDGKVGGSGKYKNVAWLRRKLGTSTQTLDYILGQADPTVFTADFRGRGIAYLAVQLKFEGNLGGVYKTGVPNITVLTRGKKCYDPRTTTTIWTWNPAVILRDYLVNEVGFDSSEIDDTLVIAAANICDQPVNIPGPSTQLRYRCNLVLSADEDWEENVKSIVDTMRGRIVFRDGKWRIYAGAWEVPTVSIGQSDWVGPTRVQASAPMEDRWNAVRVWYVDKERNYQRVECFQRRNTTYETADGDRLWKELEIPGCDNEYEAQRHGELCLRASRNQLKIVGHLRPEFLKLSTWEPVSVTDGDYGWNAKTFRVYSMEMTPQGSVEVVLVEEGSATWTDLAAGDYNTITTVPTIDPGASLPSTRTNFSASPQAGSIEFAWDVTSDSMPDEQTRLVEYTSSGYANLGTELWRGIGTRINIPKTDVTTRYYWIQGAVGSYLGAYTPNTYGYPMAANSGGGAGSTGSPGLDAITVGLTLPTIALTATNSGVVPDYSAAAGFLQVFKGGVDVTTYAATRASSQAGVTGTVNSADGSPWAANSKGAYRVTDCTSEIGVLWTEAVYSGTTYLRPFTVSKARTGDPGVNAQLLSLRSNGQVFRYSGSGTNIGVNTISFDADLKNISGTVGFKAHNYSADGTGISSYDLGGAGNNDRSLHVSSFTQAGSTAYCTVVASLSGGYTDRITVVRVQEGAAGATGAEGGGQFTLVAHGSGTGIATTQSFYRTDGGYAWNFGYYSTESYRGGAFISAVPICAGGGGEAFIGLNGDPTTDADYSSIDYAFYVFYLGGQWKASIYESGIGMYGPDVINTTDVFTIVYDGAYVRWYISGVLKRTVWAGAGRTFHLDSSIVHPNQGWQSIRFGSAGAVAFNAVLTNEAHTLPSSSSGYVPAYTGATGQMRVWAGAQEVTAAESWTGCGSIVFSVNCNPQALTATINNSGYYDVTGGLDAGETGALMWLRAAIPSGPTIDKAFTLAKAYGGVYGQTGLPGVIGPSGANLFPNGDMRTVNSATGLIAGWSITEAGTLSLTGGFDNGPCAVIGSGSTYGTLWLDQYIEVDPLTTQIDLSIRVRAPTSGQYFFAGIACYDGSFNNQPYAATARAMLKVYATANSGATSIQVYKPQSSDLYWYTTGGAYGSYPTLGYSTAGAGWPGMYPDADHDKAWVLITAVNSAGSANYDTLTLNSGLTRTVLAGGDAELGNDGGTYIYWNGLVAANSTWTEYRGFMRGFEAPFERYGNPNGTNRFRNRTRYIRPLIFKYTGGTQSDLYVDDYVAYPRKIERIGEFNTDPHSILGAGAWNWDPLASATSSLTPIIYFSEASSGPFGNDVIILGTGSHSSPKISAMP